MDNDSRTAIYLRDRTRLTSAQRRRVAKHDRMSQAELSRNMRRRARQDVLRAERRRRFAIRALFSRRVAS